MLTDHAAHQLPFYEFFYTNKYEEEVKINKTIDKQFWQSVNQVRVSGAGLTNYAIAKDDVGNWYVKSYSSDPNDIIQSAKNLAMFSAGSSMGANFLARGGQPAGKSVVSEGATEAPTTKEARSTLAKQFDRVTARYEKRTKESRAELAKEIRSLNAKVRSALAGQGLVEADLQKMFPDPASEPAANDNKPSAELAELMKALKEDNKDGKAKPLSTFNLEIASGLRSIKRYRSQAQGTVNTMMPPAEATATQPTTAENSNGLKPAEAKPAETKKYTKEQREEAKKAVDKVFQDLIQQFIKERQTANGEYESALLLISESAGL
jgi:hypothetical protein